MSLSLVRAADGAGCVVDPMTRKALAFPALDDNRSDVDKKKQKMTTVGAANDFDSVVKRRR